ncbi:MAG TPA: metallophosphoesterase family protein [Rhizomicrobium sp.]|nr:metallophosphoesterase family protein [Rhizomicrobium sp.]
MSEFDFEISRRKLLAAAGLGGGAVLASALLSPGEAAEPSRAASAPPVMGLHLQFGEDAASEIVASWHTLEPVQNPRMLLGYLDGTPVAAAQAESATYTDAKSGRLVHAWHARLAKLTPGTSYMYAALHDGAEPEFGTFTAAPRGRAAFTFTSFGDQGTPTLGKAMPQAGGAAVYLNDNLGSPFAADTVLGVERVKPLFHLLNGDLCYANLAEDRIRTWWDFWANNSRSAKNRPWMPAPGNHENERGNGAIGYRAYQTYFALPATQGQTEATRGLWYGFTVGSVRVIVLANDDVAYQDGGDSYVRGYSNGAQAAWLEKELAATRANRAIDWIVICMHQVAISTADKFNGADLGIREEWLPLFDRYGVDLVLCGHEHHYERSHPLRGHDENATLTPRAAATATDAIDTTKGTVHMVIGGGGTSIPSNQLFFDPPHCRVITRVGEPGANGKRAPVYVTEDAPWSAVRNAARAYGFAHFAVDPGQAPGSRTSIIVTYYDVVGRDGQVSPFEKFVLHRPRRDGA